MVRKHSGGRDGGFDAPGCLCHCSLDDGNSYGLRKETERFALRKMGRNKLVTNLVSKMGFNHQTVGDLFKLKNEGLTMMTRI
jgi:hypothetical protein